MHPIVENAVIIGTAHPGEVSLVEVLPDLFHFEMGVIGTHPVDIGADQVEHEGLLMAGKVIESYTLVAHLKIVPECAGKDARWDVFRDYRLASLLGG